MREGHQALAEQRKAEAGSTVNLRETFKNWTFLKKFEEVAMEKGFQNFLRIMKFVNYKHACKDEVKN